jgi:hypothetical protein
MSNNKASGPWSDAPEYVIDGDYLIIRVRVDAVAVKSAPFTSTGKSKLIGSSHGWDNIPGRKDIGITVNVIAKPSPVAA